MNDKHTTEKPFLYREKKTHGPTYYYSSDKKISERVPLGMTTN